MRKEEAIRWLTNEKWKNANNKYKKEWNEAFDLAIEALKGGDAEMLNEDFRPKYMQQSRHDDGRMTREEAIEYLDGMKIVIPICNELKELTDERNEAIDMAIEALSQPIVAKHFDIQSGYIYCSPQIAENVKVVVRCKDCRHIYKNDFCSFYGCPTEADDFCSHGERGEE